MSNMQHYTDDITYVKLELMAYFSECLFTNFTYC